MALAVTTIWEVETTGSDTLNGGAFDPGQTAGMFTDGAATSANTTAPVFTSASYNFVAGDVGAWVYVASGTNWTAGWYKIASLAANAATLTGTIGQAVLKTVLTPSVVVGCATVASPTGATWSIDYSQQAAAQFAYTDLASAGAGLTVSSAAFPFAKQQVGNSIVITGGTNFTAGRYVIASVAAAVATVVGPGNITTGAGASGTGGLGGALVSPGKASSVGVAQNQYFIKTGTYTITSATPSIAGGCFAPTGGNPYTTSEGYGAVRGDRVSPPTLILNTGVSTSVIVDISSGTYQRCQNLIIDGHGETSSRGLALGTFTWADLVTVKNCTNNGVQSGGALSVLSHSSVTGCSTQPAVAITNTTLCVNVVAYGNTVTGFSTTGYLVNCLSYSNSGASSDGFLAGTTRMQPFNCTAYGNGRHGFYHVNGGVNPYLNCVSVNNGGFGFQSDQLGTAGAPVLINCAGYNNTSGNVNTTNFLAGNRLGFVTLTGDPFVDAASGNFAMNTTVGAGAACRAASYPGVFPVGLTTSYLDIGAVQHADSGGGGSIFGGLVVR